MIGWVAALQLAVSLAAGEVGSADAGKAESLLSQLREKEHQIHLLRQRVRELEWLEGASFYSEAQSLGIVELVRDSGLPEQSQRRVAAAIVKHAWRNGLDPLLIVALIRTESSFDNYAKS